MSKGNDISAKVPEQAVLNAFGGILAVSPDIYRHILEKLAAQYDVSVEELAPYVALVLESQPPLDPEDF